ncbi:MAG TPA: 50S ribosomal protein L9 [Bacteroidia bacterium]|jgi:large subunit ribosomal protein L9|nr:50S ribosomal protein L9 [Bacteroidia bacterium]
MEIILTKDVEHLGNQHELVKVRPGYARNFLIPRGLAQVATESNRKALTELLKQRAHKEEKAKTSAEAASKKLKDIVVKIPAKVGENGKIFGSVNAIQIAEALQKLGYTVERKNIDVAAEHIKSVGNYTAKVRLHKELTIELAFEVVAE